MKISNEVIEAACAAEQVFLPNRYQQPFVKAFQELTGEEVPEMQGRKLTVRSNGRTYRWARGRNIPRIVGWLGEFSTVPTIGLTGSEWCLEYESGKQVPPMRWDRMTKENLGCLALIAPADLSLEESSILAIAVDPDSGKRRPILNVVTTFPETIRQLSMTDRFIFAMRLCVDGGVESVADAFDMAAVDLVSTGRTLEENDFVVLEELMPVYPALVQPKRESSK